MPLKLAKKLPHNTVAELVKWRGSLVFCQIFNFKVVLLYFGVIFATIK